MSTRTAFREVQRGGVTFLAWSGSELADRVVATFSTRLGGVSRGPFATLNVGGAVGDDAAAVAENRGRYLRAVGVGRNPVVTVQQVHGTDVLYADPAAAEPIALTAHGQELRRMGRGDGLLVDRPGVFVMTFHADCAPIYLVDPVAGVGVLVHAGWRGTVAGAAASGVQAAVAAGAKPARILAGIGPAIGPCCYEVDEPVIERVVAAYGREADALLRPQRPGHARLDLWEANRRGLLAAGVPAENIAVARRCTFCGETMFFSHRRAVGRPTGRMAALLGFRGDGTCVRDGNR